MKKSIITTASLCLLLQNPVVLAKEVTISEDYVENLESFISKTCEAKIQYEVDDNIFFRPHYLKSEDYKFACSGGSFYFGFKDEDDKKITYEISILSAPSLEGNDILNRKLLTQTWEKINNEYVKIETRNPVTDIFPRIEIINKKRENFDIKQYFMSRSI